MLQKLNERIQGAIAWIVIALIALTFMLFGVDYFMQSHQASAVEVAVNGKAISKQDFEINYRRARQQHDPAKLTPASELALRKQVFDDMIKNEVTVQGAKANGFGINKEQADAAIIQIPQFHQDGHFSAARYQQALSSAMFTPDSFLKEVQQGMLLNQLRFAFIGSAFALPEEVNHFVKLYMQTRDYDYLVIPTSLFMEKNKITADAIKNYYDKYQKEFIAPERISIDFVRLSMQQIKDNTLISEDDLKHYYDDNQNSFLTPAQWQVAHILFAMPPNASPEMQEQTEKKAQEAYQVLKTDPQQFSTWVKTKSDDKLSIASGGLLPWLTAGQSEFDKVLVNLSKPGEITPPVKSAHGYEIFKLVAYKPAAIKPYSEVKQEIKGLLSIDLAQAKYAQLLEQLNDLSYQAPDSLLPVAEALKLPIEQTEFFSRQGGTSDITKNRQVVNTAFSHDVLKLGNNSEPVQLNNDSVIVLRAKQHIPAKQSPLAEVKEAIVEKLALKMAKKRAEEMGLSFLSSAKEGKQATLLSQWPQLRWQAMDQAARETDKVDPIINEFAFGIPGINSQEGRTLKNGDYLIVHLKKINDGQFEALDKEQQASLAQQIEASYGEMDYDLYVNDLLAKAKIEKQ